MQSPFTDTGYLAYQYDDSAKLRIRGETHRLYTVNQDGSHDDFANVELHHIDPRPGLWTLDVGCGPGRVASSLQARGVRYVGLDRSNGLLREACRATPGRYLQADAQA